MSIDTASLSASVLSQQSAAFSQQVATLAVRRQLDAERSVAGLVAETAKAPAAAAPAPPGQGQRLDMRV
ncbi:hypothetical protein [Methylobacterium frigidaeris]|uniref:Motility protein n=1 Tax=Methylobacterium frigidaeris TaxID=2038277 RepID=A0AA37HDN8_9HYPH|nr:hypothetical protein [Methylobacterium frigidaeris]PIK68650.1 hypothetical protein CS379_33885 [Methylobacterium frigidaeris]GJD64096.1 hypothetical protein MPEAHAMD_4270 [Methylobacterium frigidaeris]